MKRDEEEEESTINLETENAIAVSKAALAANKSDLNGAVMNLLENYHGNYYYYYYTFTFAVYWFS